MFRCIVLVPSYNSGALLHRTVLAVLAVWADVVVVIDGSTDGSGQAVEKMLATHAGLHVLHLPGMEARGRLCCMVRNGHCSMDTPMC